MVGSRFRRSFLCALAVVSAAACSPAETTVGAVERSAVDVTTTTTTPPPAETTTTTTPPPETTTPPAETTTTTDPPVERVTVSTGFSPYATAEGVVLHHPADVIERIGFHQSGHDGARHQEPTTDAARAFTLETRERGTGGQTAADIVVQPDSVLRAPVTGTVVRGGGYTLYCDNHDEYVVIEPDGRPGWEVKLLHFEGLQVRAGDRVEGGVTIVGARGRVLPFDSQVDEFTAEPSWPHVHVEVVDPSIPDRPSGGGC